MRSLAEVARARLSPPEMAGLLRRVDDRGVDFFRDLSDDDIALLLYSIMVAADDVVGRALDRAVTARGAQN